LAAIAQSNQLENAVESAGWRLLVTLERDIRCSAREL